MSKGDISVMPKGPCDNYLVAVHREMVHTQTSSLSNHIIVQTNQSYYRYQQTLWSLERKSMTFFCILLLIFLLTL